MSHASKDAIVSVENMSFSHGPRTIFDRVNISITRGNITAIMGPSGTGKTTLLKLIGGQLRPQSGQVTVDQQVVHQLHRRHLFELRKRMGMLFQSGALLTDLSVFDNVAFPMREHTQLSESMIRALVLMKLDAVGLRGAHPLMPSQLSGGMARRVALARAIALDPKIMMYDEPFAGQDPISMGVLLKLIQVLNNALNLTSIIVTHDIKEAFTIADEVYLISEGKVIEHGPPDDIQNSSSKWVQQFIQGHYDGPVPFHYPANDYQTDLYG
ncbi:MAG: ATP-binding cassette domain-containing protein [Gammaproteobacteria bacterium]|nr:ATP-binding cassette domain-containing protein [Gammaproteobacteria bacterium]